MWGVKTRMTTASELFYEQFADVCVYVRNCEGGLLGLVGGRKTNRSADPNEYVSAFATNSEQSNEDHL